MEWGEVIRRDKTVGVNAGIILAEKKKASSKAGLTL
jgi:hypothetical protein